MPAVRGAAGALVARRGRERRHAGRAGRGGRPARPASCEGPGILTSCELVRGRPAALAFLAPGRERCEDELDALARAARGDAERADRGGGAARRPRGRAPARSAGAAGRSRSPTTATRSSRTSTASRSARRSRSCCRAAASRTPSSGEQDVAQLRARLRALVAAGPRGRGRERRGPDRARRRRAGAARRVPRAARCSRAPCRRRPARTTDPGTRERLALLAARMRGGRAVELRREPVPAAYRVFYRHIGIDPDSTRTPVEEAAIARLVEGGHRSRGPLPDALLLALLDTGVLVNAVRRRRAGRAPGAAARPSPASGWGRDRTPRRSAPGGSCSPTRRRALARAVRRARAGRRAGPAHDAAAARGRADPGRAADPRRGGAVDVPGVARRRGPGVDSAQERGAMTRLDVPTREHAAARRAARRRRGRGPRARCARRSRCWSTASPAPSSTRCPTAGSTRPCPALRGPRVLTLGELERLRDALADRVAAGARAASRSASAGARTPACCWSGCCSSPGATATCASRAASSARAGCGVWHVRPRLGVVGRLMGWWQVKLSSGCPLAA